MGENIIDFITALTLKIKYAWELKPIKVLNKTF